MKIANELTRLMRAIADLEDAKAHCEYDWDYFLRVQTEAVEDAEKAYLAALKKALENDA
jgi:hypothetical protein